MRPTNNHAPPKRAIRRHPARGAVAALVGLALAAVLFDTWVVRGLFVPLVVQGASMSPGLLGAHRDFQCADCRRVFACNLESLPSPDSAAICPHCGAANDLTRGVDVSGDRVLVNCSAFYWRRPRRWETVVVRSPDDAEMLCVKRVVGLPGETIEIVDGDVLIDGEVARKDLATMREMAVPVAGSEAVDRWHADAGTWQPRDGWFVHEQADAAIDWLSYQHREPGVRGTQGSEQSILDGSPFDQNESRLLNEVDDVMLRLEIDASSTTKICLRATYRGDEFVVGLDPAAGEVRLECNGQTVRRIGASELPKLLKGPAQLEFVVADRRVQFALRDRLLLQYDYVPDAAENARAAALAVGARNGPVRVRKLEVLRDVYYTSRPLPGGGQYRLGKQEYFLLGDNSPHSLDSRAWSPRGGVSAGLLLGPAIVWSSRSR